MTWPCWLRAATGGRINRVALRLAGHAAVADVEHVGRRTGTVRHTPVRAFRVGDTIVIGANFGAESDWVQNIAAAGGCRVRLGRDMVECGPPRLVPVEDGVRGMPWAFAFALKHVVRTKFCVALPVLASRPA